MTTKSKLYGHRSERSLREAARQRLKQGELNVCELDLKDMQALVEELEIHRAELTIQNEELQAAYNEVAVARERYRSLFDEAPVGYLTVDGHGRIAQANVRAAELLGAKPDELTGRELSDFVHPDAQDALYLHRRALSKGAERQEDELALRADGPQQRYVQIVSVPEGNGEGADPRFRCTLVDITELKEAQKALQEERDCLEERVAERTARLKEVWAHREQLLNSLGEGLFALDAAGRFTYLNPAALSMFGFHDQDEVRGRESHGLVHFSDTQHQEAPTNRCPILEVLASGERLKGWEDRFYRADGTSFPVVLDVSPVTEGGRVLGVVVAFSGVTDRKAALEQLTPREHQVLQYLGRGLTNKEVAQRLGLSHRTVEDHRARIMKKLDVKSLAELVRLA